MVGCLFDCLFGLLFVCLLDCLFAWLLGWLIALLVGCFVGWLVVRLVGWWFGLVVCFVWLFGCFVGWSVGCLVRVRFRFRVDTTHTRSHLYKHHPQKINSTPATSETPTIPTTPNPSYR